MSEHYQAPVDDLLFLFREVLDCERLLALDAYRHVDMDLVAAVLNEGARFAGEVLAPLNVVGDTIGSRLENGRVITPPGFKEAYRSYVEGGWPSLDLPLEHGGQGLPLAVQVAFAEMVDGACTAFGMLTLMERAAAWLLIEHAEPELVARVVPKLVAGEWGATICISEPQAGSDVGRITTRAVPSGDGRYTLTGTKIFITFGDHDLTEQICHMVLARTPGAAPGTRGLSLFLVPAREIDAAGRPGERNRLGVSRVEHKMGLKASPTCVLDFDGATGYRIGAEGAGLRTMFTMVNLMRLQVGVQGVAIGGAATGKALRYAVERPQGGAPDAPAVCIVEHADVRRMLLAMRARTEAFRALVLETALQLDIARHAGNDGARARALGLAEWLLPICKACSSEAGFEVANLGIQVHGGHGYVSDAGAEQYARDIRVAAIYEGTNGIQALDLVTRKLLRDDGRRYGLFIDRVRADLTRADGNADLRPIAAAVTDAVTRVDAGTALLLEKAADAPRDVEAGATAYLRMLGLLAGGWMWLRMSAAATGEGPLHRAKRASARYYADYLMPEILTLERQLAAGSAALDLPDLEALSQR
jgi:alkylation response protein AidB-like acyl-CoA dehydrogenase